MIRLTIEINEEKNFNLKNIDACKIKVEVQETWIKATSHEREISNRYKELINVDKKVQFMNESKEDINDIIREIAKALEE